jgi:hypothetical protein
VHSKRPLKLAEAKEVIATQIKNFSPGFDIKHHLFSESDILAYCPSLVTVIDGSDKELHLAHFSVKEFLLDKNSFGIITTSIAITMTCSTYLTEIYSSNSKIKEKFPMARYTAELWSSYTALAQASRNTVRMTITF